MSGSSHLHGSRALARLLRVIAVGAAALSALLPAGAAFAQSADDSGWFDSSSGEAEPGPEPYYVDDQVAPAPQSDVPDTDPSALTTFRPALDPYGTWVSDSKYGTVWVPNRDVVGADFAPYVSRGRWALTADDDWIWVSDYPFGWAVFHYGRWVWTPGNGWAWVPGRTYANAWVVWRVPTSSYAYVGWAPMPPTWGWYNGYAFSVWYSPPLPYVFCPSSYVFHHGVHHHIVRDRHLVHRIAGHSHVYPTPYRAPAAPSRHTASAPRIRAAAVAPSRPPRGPALSAARIPRDAVPAVRTAPPANATRLTAGRVAPASFSRQGAASPQARRSAPRSSAPARNQIEPRTVAPARTRIEPRTVAPSRAQVEPRTVAPSRAQVEPRTVAPARTRVEPRTVAPAPRTVAPAPRTVAPARTRIEPRTVSPSRIRVAPSPSRSFSPSPSRSAPSFPRAHSGGSFRKR